MEGVSLDGRGFWGYHLGITGNGKRLQEMEGITEYRMGL